MSLRHTWFYASQLHLVQTPVNLLVTPVLLGAGNGTLAGTQAPIAIAQTAQDGKIVGIALLLACDGEAVLLKEHVIHMNKLPQNQGFHFVACCWVCQRHIICVGCGASCLAAGAQVMGLPLRDLATSPCPPASLLMTNSVSQHQSLMPPKHIGPSTTAICTRLLFYCKYWIWHRLPPILSIPHRLIEIREIAYCKVVGHRSASSSLPESATLLKPESCLNALEVRMVVTLSVTSLHWHEDPWLEPTRWRWGRGSTRWRWGRRGGSSRWRWRGGIKRNFAHVILSHEKVNVVASSMATDKPNTESPWCANLN